MCVLFRVSGRHDRRACQACMIVYGRPYTMRHVWQAGMLVYACLSSMPDSVWSALDVYRYASTDNPPEPLFGDLLCYLTYHLVDLKSDKDFSIFEPETCGFLHYILQCLCHQTFLSTFANFWFFRISKIIAKFKIPRKHGAGKMFE